MSAEPKVTDLHPTVAARSAEWQRIADVLAGPDALKYSARRETYLPRLPGQYLGTGEGGLYIDEYDSYVRRAQPLTSRAQRAHNGMVGMACRKDAQVDVPELVEPWLRNLTLDGASLDDVARAIIREGIAFSWGALVCNFDDFAGRPYVRHLGHGAVTNWAREQIGGRLIPVQVVIREQFRERKAFGAEIGTQYRVFDLVEANVPVGEEYPLGAIVQAQVWREIVTSDGKSDWMPHGEPQTPVRGGKPLGLIPVIPYTAHAAGQWEPTKPPVLELVDLILGHYRNSADYENLVHFAGAGNILFGKGIPRETKIRAGGSAAVVTESPDADLRWVLTGGQGGEEIRKAMEDKRGEMGVAIARLLLSDEKRVAETAESQRIAFAGDDATLADVVSAAEAALDEALAWVTWWGGAADSLDDAREITSVKLNREFLAEGMAATDLVQLGLEVDAGRMSKRRLYFLAQRGGLAEPGATWDDELEQIRSEGGDAPTPAPVFGDLPDMDPEDSSGDDPAASEA